MLKRAHHFFPSIGQIKSLHAISFYLSTVHFNIISCLLVVLPSGSFPSQFPTKTREELIKILNPTAPIFKF